MPADIRQEKVGENVAPRQNYLTLFSFNGKKMERIQCHERKPASGSGSSVVNVQCHRDKNGAYKRCNTGVFQS